jgi:hypothetical protein
VDPRGFSCVVGGWSASAEGEMTSSPREPSGVLLGGRLVVGMEHKHKRCSLRNLGGKGALSNIKFLFDLRSLRAWVCVRVTAARSEQQNATGFGGEREDPGRHPPSSKGQGR